MTNKRARAATPDAYFVDPFSQYYLGDCFFAIAFKPDLFCLVAWGKIDVEDFQQLSDVLICPELKNHPARRQLVCHEGIESVSTQALLAFFNFTRKHPKYQAGVVREAVSRGPGLVGMIAEGFYRTTPLPFPARAFQSRASALEWVAPELPDGEILAELRALTDGFGGKREPLIAQVRIAIEELGFKTDLRSVARSLGVSPRTLQRKLQSAGTRFESELALLRISAARERLLTTNINAKTIAVDLGYASPSAFINAFRRSVGTTPNEWRAQHSVSS